MLHFGPDTGFDFLCFQFICCQLLSSAMAPGNEPRLYDTYAQAASGCSDNRHPRALHPPLITTVQQFIGGYDVVNVSGRGVDAVNRPKRVVDTNVHLHAKYHWLSFLFLFGDN